MRKRQIESQSGNIPAYIQVASALRRRIETGEWLPGEKISTLEELEEEFKRARVTVRQAVGLLVQEGLLSSQQGRGTFVAEKVNDTRWLTLETSWDGMVRSIKDNVPHFIDVEDPPPFPRLFAGEGKMAKEYGFLRSYQMRNGIPYSVVSVHLERTLFDQYREKFRKQTALAALDELKDTIIGKADVTMTIGTADPEIAQLLNVSLSAPTAECHFVITSKSNIAIYVAEIVYRSDCIRLHMDLFESNLNSK